jgi:hypothetical protein
MLTRRVHEASADDQAIALIAEQVIGALRDDLELIVAELSTPTTNSERLTVGQVAHRLGVARSTVYAHWREWGGYKIGGGPKARIRFDSSALPVGAPARKKLHPAPDAQPIRKRPRRRPPRRDLLVAAPRLATPLDEVA